MKPVAIFRHASVEGAGYFATFLAAHSIPSQLIAIDRSAPVPTKVDEFAGLCFMGGPMSVNDPIPWVDDECALILDAVARGIPVIGHCLGGQLMCKAMGGRVTRNPAKEIGWSAVRAENSAVARQWLGSAEGHELTVFQWHGETFSIPPGATRILSNEFCTNQMFAVGPHLAMQCHVEMTPEMIAEWSTAWAEEVAGLSPLPASVQTPKQIQEETATRLPVMRRLADRVYSVWIAGLQH